MQSIRSASLATALATGLLLAPAGALAKGGGGTPPPAPASAPAAVQCDPTIDGALPDGGQVFSNQVGQAGCLSAVLRGGSVGAYRIDLTPGWTASIGSTSTGIKVTFTETATGRTATARIEPGKTDIRA